MPIVVWCTARFDPARTEFDPDRSLYAFARLGTSAHPELADRPRLRQRYRRDRRRGRLCLAGGRACPSRWAWGAHRLAVGR